jgi:hypothetical protein
VIAGGKSFVIFNRLQNRRRGMAAQSTRNCNRYFGRGCTARWVDEIAIALGNHLRHAARRALPRSIESGVMFGEQIRHRHLPQVLA